MCYLSFFSNLENAFVGTRSLITYILLKIVRVTGNKKRKPARRPAKIRTACISNPNEFSFLLKADLSTRCTVGQFKKKLLICVLARIHCSAISNNVRDVTLTFHMARWFFSVAGSLSLSLCLLANISFLKRAFVLSNASNAEIVQIVGISRWD